MVKQNVSNVLEKQVKGYLREVIDLELGLNIVEDELGGNLAPVPLCASLFIDEFFIDQVIAGFKFIRKARDFHHDSGPLYCRIPICTWHP